MKTPNNNSKPKMTAHQKQFVLQLTTSAPCRPDLKGLVERVFSEMATAPVAKVTWMVGKDGGL
jgi:hypothetical protein